MKSYFYYIREAIPDDSDYTSESENLKDFFNDPGMDVEEYIRHRTLEGELLIDPAFQ